MSRDIAEGLLEHARRVTVHILLWVTGRLPLSIKKVLTQSSALAAMRKSLLIPMPNSQVVVSLNAPLAGYRMRLNMREGHRRYALGTYEPDVCGLIHSCLGRGGSALDIGANIGYITLLMAHQVGSEGKIVAFEPSPSVFEVLCENLRLNDCGQVRAVQAAVGDADGWGMMKLDEDVPLSFTGRLSPEGDLVVPLVSIDNYVRLEGVERLDLVKIDVEGSEDLVVRGMRKTLQRFCPKVILEVHETGGAKSEALRVLSELGYTLSRLRSGGLSQTDIAARGGHILASCLAYGHRRER